MPRRAKLTAGRNWPGFLQGQRTRPEAFSRTPLDALNDDDLRAAADKRVAFLEHAMQKNDRRRAATALSETMHALRLAADLPGDQSRRRTLRQVVTWLSLDPGDLA